MNKKSKIIISLVCVCFAVVALIFSVVASNTPDYSINNKIVFITNDALVKVTRNVEYISASQIRSVVEKENIETEVFGRNWEQAIESAVFQNYNNETKTVLETPIISEGLILENENIYDNINIDYSEGYIFRVTFIFETVNTNGVVVDIALPEVDEDTNTYLKSNSETSLNVNKGTQASFSYYLGLINAETNLSEIDLNDLEVNFEVNE